MRLLKVNPPFSVCITDVDECRSPGVCPSGKCVNTRGSYKCQACGPGFRPDAGRCLGKRLHLGFPYFILWLCNNIIIPSVWHGLEVQTWFWQCSAWLKETWRQCVPPFKDLTVDYLFIFLFQNCHKVIDFMCLIYCYVLLHLKTVEELLTT